MGVAISIMNFKGGASKTTVAVNLAATLAKYGNKTLLVDLDPQASATLSLVEEPEFLKNVQGNKDFHRFTSYGLFKGLFDVAAQFENNEEQQKQFVDKSNCHGPLHLIPSIWPLAEIENDLPNQVITQGIGKSSAPKAVQGLNQLLTNLYQRLDQIPKNAYKFIILDTPPNCGLFAKAAYYFSDYLIVPTLPDKISLMGIHYFANTIKTTFAEDLRLLAQNGRTSKKPPILSVIFSRYKDKRDEKRRLIYEDYIRNKLEWKSTQFYTIKESEFAMNAQELSKAIVDESIKTGGKDAKAWS